MLSVWRRQITASAQEVNTSLVQIQAEAPTSDFGNEIQLTANDTITEFPNIDESCIYVTASMGGMVTWGLITSYPDFFAAAMPVCGQGDLSLMETVKDLPIWVFHAADDPVVPMYGQKDEYKHNDHVIGTKTHIYRLKELGSKVKFTEYSSQDMVDAGVPVDQNTVLNHFSWIPTYNNQEAINWLFSHKKASL